MAALKPRTMEKPAYERGKAMKLRRSRREGTTFMRYAIGAMLVAVFLGSAALASLLGSTSIGGNLFSP